MATEAWVLNLRGLIRDQYGRAWSVFGNRGKLRVDYKPDPHTRETKQFSAITWEKSNSTQIVELIKKLDDRLQSKGLTFAEVVEQLAPQPKPAATDEPGALVVGEVNWTFVERRFFESLQGRRQTTLNHYRSRITNALQLLSQTKPPLNGVELMRSYGQAFFDRCPPGSPGRRRHFDDISSFLKFAVKRLGAGEEWLPAVEEELAEMVGVDNQSKYGLPRVPVKPDQLAGLLDGIAADGDDPLWLMVATIGLFGLRPGELSSISVADGRLYVGPIKRDKRSILKPAKEAKPVVALEINDFRNDGPRVLELLRRRQEGDASVQFPKQVETAIAATHAGKCTSQRVGHKVRYYLVGAGEKTGHKGCKHWNSLVSETPGLVVYGLRHGYAWRGAVEQGLPIRYLASQMRHSQQEHEKSYGQWTQQDDIEAFLAFKKQQRLAAKTA